MRAGAARPLPSGWARWGIPRIFRWTVNQQLVGRRTVGFLPMHAFVHFVSFADGVAVFWVLSCQCPGAALTHRVLWCSLAWQPPFTRSDCGAVDIAMADFSLISSSCCSNAAANYFRRCVAPFTGSSINLLSISHALGALTRNTHITNFWV